MCSCSSAASLHSSLCNYWKLLNSGSNRVETRRRQLIDNFGVLPKTVYFVVFNISEPLIFILALDSHLLLNLHSCPSQYFPPTTQLYWFLSPTISTFPVHPIPINFFSTQLGADSKFWSSWLWRLVQIMLLHLE